MRWRPKIQPFSTVQAMVYWRRRMCSGASKSKAASPWYSPVPCNLSFPAGGDQRLSPQCPALHAKKSTKSRSKSARVLLRTNLHTYEHHTNNLSMVTVASILGCFCSALCTVFTLSIPRNAEELFVDDLHQTFVHQSMKHQRFTRKMGSPRPNPNPCIWKAHEKALTH